MFTTTGILIALIALTIALAAVFLVRSSVTAGATGKILAFVGLCVLPVLCIGAGWSVQEQRSQQTSSCIACHSMETHGKSLYIADASYIPAQHFQNHLVPPDKACYTCHTDYAFYGSFKDKIKGLKYIYMQYVSTPPKVIHISGAYSNLQCLHCHANARNFTDNPAHSAIMGSLKTDQTSCLTCHDMIHNVSEVAHLKMWVEGNAPSTLASSSSSSTEAKPAPAATAGPSKTETASSAGGATSAQGKSIFDSHGCAGCHGESGGGGSGPALTHSSSQYPPAKLTALLKAPTAKMKAGGMVALTVNAADMKALVSYVTSLGGASASSAATPPASTKSSTSSAKVEPTAPAAPSKEASAATPAPAASSPAPAKTQPAAAAEPSKASTATSAGGTTAAHGKTIFDSQRCGGCHGESGGGGSGPALTHISSQYPPAKLTAILKAPNAAMKAAGMVPLTLNAADMEALVTYVTSLGGTAASSAAPPPASAKSSTAPAQAKPAAAAEPSKASTATSAGGTSAAHGKTIYDSQRCGACHGESGGGGSGPALTHISGQYPPAQLTAILKAPNAAMKTAGMVPLTLNAADMEALVTYVTSLGGTSPLAATRPASGASSPAPAKVEPPTTTEASTASTGSLRGDASAARGKSLYQSHGCGPCHGPTGAGGAGPALTHISSQYPPAQLTAILKAPNAGMKAAGMIPVTLNPADMEALVSYVISLGRASAPAKPSASSPAPAKGEPGAPTGGTAGSATAAGGKAIFDSHGCAGCHGETGAGGSGPALTHVSSQYSPAKLAAVLKAPTAQMKAAGMAALKVKTSDMKALVSYVTSLGGTSDTSR